MKAGDESFDDRTSDEFKRAYARKDFRREETCADLLGIVLKHHRHLDHG